jgi:hypothetical protein
MIVILLIKGTLARQSPDPVGVGVVGDENSTVTRALESDRRRRNYGDLHIVAESGDAEKKAVVPWCGAADPCFQTPSQT